MATSTNSSVFTNLTYSSDIKSTILKSGGTIVFMKDNIIVASEISEAQYRELLKNPNIEKMDILPLKRYQNELTPYKDNSKTDPPKFNVTKPPIIPPSPSTTTPPSTAG